MQTKHGTPARPCPASPCIHAINLLSHARPVNQIKPIPSFTADGSPLADAGIDYREIAVKFPYLSSAEATTPEDNCYGAAIGGLGWVCLDSTFTGAKLARHAGELVLTEYPQTRLTAAFAEASLAARLI